MRSHYRLTASAFSLLLGLASFPLKAGVVLDLKNGTSLDGKLTLTGTGIHVEGSSSSDVNLADVLEADFSDAPFHLQFFQSKGEAANQLPSDWTTKAIGPADPSGSATYAAGTLTLNGDGCDYQDAQPDHYYFAGRPWDGDGQWTCYLKETTGEVGFTMRKTLDAGSPMLAIGVGSDGGGMMHYGGAYSGIGGKFPTFLRVTRSGSSVDFAESANGTAWQFISQNNTDLNTGWIGFVINSRQGKTAASAIIDQITFAPIPAQPETVPTGVLFRSGTFLAGTDFNIAAADGGVGHDKKVIPVKTSQIAAVVYHPTTLHEIDASAAQPGMILKNGDYLTSDIQLLQGGMVQVMSLNLGLTSYFVDTVRACVVNSVASLPSDYEIRLRDGSIIRAKSFTLDKDQMTIQEIGGLSIQVGTSEVAQFRAGLARVQPLISLAWKVHGDTSAKAAKETAASSSPATNEPAAAVASGTTKAPASTDAEVATWEGPNQEQMLVVPEGVAVDFPLRGKFRALAMRVALAPGSAEGAQAILHVLVGGKEIATSVPLKTDDAPRSMWCKLDQPAEITLRVASAQPGARIVVIDPVAIRAK
jgi:hypothetical protein